MTSRIFPWPRLLFVPIVLFLLGAPLAGCPGDDDDADDDDMGDDDVGGTIELHDPNNYTYSGTIDAPTVVTAEATDLDICWDGLTSDIQCHEIDPSTEVDNVGLVRFRHLTEEEVEQGMSQDDLQQADIDGYVEFNNDDEVTCTTLSSMSFFGTQLDIPSEYVATGGTYMLMFTTGTQVGVGVRMITFIAPTADSENTTVDVSDGCGALEFTADLQSLAPVPVAADGPWELDWADLSQDGQDNDLDLGSIDGVMLGFYEGLDVVDLEAQILDLEIIATSLWHIELDSGTTADLAQATNDEGAFSGFEGDGAWLLALTCSRCYNPAPVFVTLLQPVG